MIEVETEHPGFILIQPTGGIKKARQPGHNYIRASGTGYVLTERRRLLCAPGPELVDEVHHQHGFSAQRPAHIGKQVQLSETSLQGHQLRFGPTAQAYSFPNDLQRPHEHLIPAVVRIPEWLTIQAIGQAQRQQHILERCLRVVHHQLPRCADAQQLGHPR
jgi:hypothetical protein